METGLSLLSGSDFLQLYIVLLLTGIAAAIWLPGWLRPEGRDRRLTDSEELAMLAGGRMRHAEAVAARLLEAGDVEILGRDRLAARSSRREGTPSECALLAAAPVRWDAIAAAIKEPAARVRAGLVEKEQLLDRSTMIQLRLVSILPLVLVFALGWYRRSAGEALGEPVGHLTALLVMTGVVAAIFLLINNPRTRAGNDALEGAREGASRLKRAPHPGEPGTAVALFGTAVLVGTPLADLHAMRQAASSDGGGTSSSDGGSDGGGGGGGCGGCGG